MPDNTIGKVISSLNWYIACEITADEATDLTLWGDDVTVDFSDASSNTVPASIYKIVQYNNSDKALVILQCTYMDTTLSEIRQEPVEIGMGSYSGLRVSKKAIHDDYVEKTTYDDKGNEHKESKKVQVFMFFTAVKCNLKKFLSFMRVTITFYAICHLQTVHCSAAKPFRCMIRL